MDPHVDPAVVLPYWLAAQPNHPKLLWSSRGGSTHTAAIGESFRLDASRLQQQLQQYPRLRLYCIHSFNSNQPQWQTFEPQLYYIPDIEIDLESSNWKLRVTISRHSDINKLCDQLKAIGTLSPEQERTSWKPSLLRRTDKPCQQEWRKSVLRAKQEISSCSLQKVVLARETTLLLSEPLSFWDTFMSWDQQAINSYRFAYQKSVNEGFISFSPERLLLREENNLFTEALAGTCARPSNAASARIEARNLLHDPKNRLEHRLVIEDIIQKFTYLGVQVNDRCETSLMQQANIQHLHHVIHAQGQPLPSDQILLSHLHPTAAIGGFPVVAAQKFIRQNEAIQRGWYAGYFGYLSADKSELAVAIRCAQINDNSVSLYAGAGIVDQSDPILEWNELEQKITLPLSIFLTDLTHVRQHSSVS